MNNFSTTKISFLKDLDKDILIDKSWKSYYFKIFRIDLDNITNFICNLKDNEIYILNPIISITCRKAHPYVNLSEQFLITNKSNPILIYNFLEDQFQLLQTQFDFYDDFYFLFLKYKLCKLNFKITP